MNSFTTLSAASRNFDVAVLTVRRRMTTLGIQPAAVLKNGCVLLDEDSVARLAASFAPTQPHPEPAAQLIHTSLPTFC
jgi:hypothetical protein